MERSPDFGPLHQVQHQFLSPWPNITVKLTRILPDFCGHSDLTEMSYGQNRP